MSYATKEDLRLLKEEIIEYHEKRYKRLEKAFMTYISHNLDRNTTIRDMEINDDGTITLTASVEEVVGGYGIICEDVSTKKITITPSGYTVK